MALGASAACSSGFSTSVICPLTDADKGHTGVVGEALFLYEVLCCHSSDRFTESCAFAAKISSHFGLGQDLGPAERHLKLSIREPCAERPTVD